VGCWRKKKKGERFHGMFCQLGSHKKGKEERKGGGEEKRKERGMLQIQLSATASALS